MEHMLYAIAAVVIGLLVLVWSADRFVDGAASLARILGMPPLLIGMIIVGFGTSMPEMIVSAFAALENSPEIALGNAYGSNIANIALILGLAAMIRPIAVASRVVRLELPILIGVTAIAGILLYTGDLTRVDAIVLVLVFAVFMGWSLWQNARKIPDHFENEVGEELAAKTMTPVQASVWTVVGLLLLVISSRALVWGSVEIATALGVTKLVIGLTVVAVGTSLPELASSIAAARKNEHDIALGNILGSNLFNTLIVVGIAGLIHPLSVPTDVLTRDFPIVALVTALLFLFAFDFKGRRRINRYEGLVLVLIYLSYNITLILTATSG